MKVKITLNREELVKLIQEKFGQVSNLRFNLSEVGDDRFGQNYLEFTVENFRPSPQEVYRSNSMLRNQLSTE